MIRSKHHQKNSSVELSTEDFECSTEAVLAKFENGSLVNRNALESVKCYSTGNSSSSNTNKFKRKIIVAETDRMQYVGANFGPYCARYHTCCDYYIGVVNKATKKVKLLNCEWYNLKPAIAGSIFGAESTGKESDSQKQQPSREQRNELTASFGSLKQQRAAESRVRHEVKAEDLHEVIQTTIENVSADIKPIVAPSQSALSDTIPPVNLEAKKVEEVYDIGDLISEDESVALESLASIWAETNTQDIKNWIMEKRYAGFALDCLLNLPTDKDKRQEKCIHLLYLHFLTTLLSIQTAQLKGNNPLPKEMPALLKKKFLATYFQTMGRKTLRGMSAKQKDKLIANIIVLALLVNNFHFDYERLLPDLKTTPRKYQLLIRAIGARLEKTGKGRQAKPSVVTLSLPLATLEENKAFRRGKR